MEYNYIVDEMDEFDRTDINITLKNIKDVLPKVTKVIDTLILGK